MNHKESIHLNQRNHPRDHPNQPTGTHPQTNQATPQTEVKLGIDFWHAVEFSKNGRTPTNHLSAARRGNPSSLDRAAASVKVHEVDFDRRPNARSCGTRLTGYLRQRNQADGCSRTPLARAGQGSPRVRTRRDPPQRPTGDGCSRPAPAARDGRTDARASDASQRRSRAICSLEAPGGTGHRGCPFLPAGDVMDCRNASDGRQVDRRPRCHQGVRRTVLGSERSVISASSWRSVTGWPSPPDRRQLDVSSTSARRLPATGVRGAAAASARGAGPPYRPRRPRPRPAGC
jgi:hypothetical protein